MTGYGKAVCEVNKLRYTVEIRSLNSKQLDLSLKIPTIFREKENELRNEAQKSIERGKVDVYISIESSELEQQAKLNPMVIRNYFKQIEAIACEYKVIDPAILFQLVMRMPDTFSKNDEALSDDVWNVIHEAFLNAIKELDCFRNQEGKKLEEDVSKRVDIIVSRLDDVKQFEKVRVETIRERIKKGLVEFFGSEKVDKDRIEQEMIFYIEKLDVTEEKVRLRNHCKYFIDTLSNEPAPGKKLGFIAQEMQREINTLGSKANDFDIQSLVVQMKDELEKIKEQLLNVL